MSNLDLGHLSSALGGKGLPTGSMHTVLIKTHTGDMYVLSRETPIDWLEGDQKVLASYGLAVNGLGRS